MNIDTALQQLANAGGLLEGAIYNFYREAVNIASECSTPEEKASIWTDTKGYLLDAIAKAERAIEACDKKIA